MKKISTFFLLILIYIHFTICKVLAKGEQKITDSQTNSNEVITLDEDYLFEPVKFTADGLKNYFEKKFNNTKYSQEILPNNFSDLLSFFQHGRRTNQKRAYTKVILKAFLQKLKSIEYVNAKKFVEFVLDLHTLISNHFEKTKEEKNPKTKAYNILYSEMVNHYDVFKKTPEAFLTNVSENICNAVLKNIQDYDKFDDISMSELKNIVIRFIECGLGKMLWTVDENIWTEFKNSCDSLYQLKDHQIGYDMEEINDLINSALARFEFLLEIIGSEITVEIYDKALNEIENGQLPWLEIEEYDEIITPKRKYLISGLKKGKIKALASKKYGILA